MKTILFALICCVFMSYAIVPMSVGNKWWYQYENKELTETSVTKEKHVISIEKDTVINNIIQKKVKYTEYKVDNTCTVSYQIWHEKDSCFYINNVCWYKVGQSDTSWSSGGGFTNGGITNGICSFEGVEYLMQKRWRNGNGPGTYAQSNMIIANGLGLYSEGSSGSFSGGKAVILVH